MLPDMPLTDDFVAQILKQEAARDYHVTASGAESFQLLPGRPLRSNAPRPNTRFLRNIIRDTDSFNATVRAKGQVDRCAPERHLPRANHINTSHDLHLPCRSEQSLPRPTCRRYNEQHYEQIGGTPRCRIPQDASLPHTQSKKSRQKRRRYEEEIEEDKDMTLPHETRIRIRPGSPSRSTPHSRSRSRSRSYSTSPKRQQFSQYREEALLEVSLRNRRHRRSPRRQSSVQEEQEYNKQLPQLRRKRKREREPDRHRSDTSDPLEALIGPRPPPKVRAWGRGADRDSAIDARFDKNYDPSADVEVGKETVGQNNTDWDLALEALRERTQWQEHRNKRLRKDHLTAGLEPKYTNVVTSSKINGEKDVLSLQWNKQGEAREWDRGKVADGSRVDVVPRWSACRAFRRTSSMTSP